MCFLSKIVNIPSNICTNQSFKKEICQREIFSTNYIINKKQKYTILKIILCMKC